MTTTTNIVDKFKEFIQNANEISHLNEMKRKLVKKQSELEAMLSDYLVSINSEAVKYQETIISLQQKQYNTKLNPRAQQAMINSYLLNLGVTQNDINALFAMQRTTPKIRNKIQLTVEK